MRPDRYNPDIHHRRSIRLRDYDYSQQGAYFVTVCTKDRKCLFGEIIDGRTAVNEAGRMVEKWWEELTRKFPSVKTDASIVMPNHFHGIIMSGVEAGLRVCPVKENGHDFIGGQDSLGAHTGAPLHRTIQWFKTMMTDEYLRKVKRDDLPPINDKLWQRNYYERIIRDDHELNAVREYVANNPVQWVLDEENPERTATTA